jgi:glycosyltransferase involved in cell wall biosynthesis
MVRLLKDPALRQRMGAAGAARVAQHFGVGRLLQGTLNAYKRASQEAMHHVSVDQP